MRLRILRSLPKPAQSIYTIGIVGKYFTFDQQPATIIETSDFSLFKRYLDGEDIRPIVDERSELGFNARRVWLLNTSVIPGGLHPKDYPQFYDALPEFVTVCGGVVELTVFTQTPLLMPNVDDQHRHWERTQAAVRGLPNVLLELVNEYDHGSPRDNTPDRSLWSMRPVGILASSGSANADSAPPTPVWDYVLYHSNDLDQFQRKVGHNAMEYAEKYGVPALSNENTRYPDRDNSEAHAYDAAMGAALLAAGSCYHSQGGKFSRLFDADERRTAAAWVAGAQSVPLEFREGQYIHRADLEGPSVIRAYEKRLGDGRSYVIRIRP